MKELTIEQKAQRYDKALAKARTIVNSINVGLIGKDSFEAVFPELKENKKESTDEKVRKALIKLVTNHASMDLFIEYDIHLDEALSWLEKQGEQKPTEWSEEDIMRIDNIIAIIEGKGYPDYVRWLESLKDKVSPQPKQEWSEEDETVLGNLIWALENDMVRANDRDEYVNWLKSLRPQDRWKPSLLRNLKKQ